MGVKIIKKLEGDCQFGLWQVVEDPGTMLQITYLTDEDLHRIYKYQSKKRRLESMSVRALVQQMTHQKMRVVYREGSRKPYLDDNSQNISISHSGEHTTILLSREKRVGIDIEFMKHPMINIAHKFINKHEKITSDPELQRLHLYIHWCAKEALYKICDKANINLRNNLTISPFDVSTQGQITGIVKNSQRWEEYLLHYQVDDNYVMAYCYK
jgi:phosphopantetheinyl transferase